MPRAEYYWCTRHHRVEHGDKMCAARHRLGPYDTVAEAERALERIQERNEEWEDQEARWRGDDA